MVNEETIDNQGLGISIQGGGTRGVISAAFLHELFVRNKTLRRRVKVWGGTSTGGIIALAYALGLPSDVCVNLYLQQSKNIFKSRGFWDKFIPDELSRSNYDNDGLIAVMKEVFGDLTMADLKTEVAIMAVDLDSTNADGDELARTRCLTRASHPNLMVWEAAVRTCSAPTYFPTFQGYCDGGIAANNASLFTYGILRKLTSNPKILDVGNGAVTRYVTGGDRLDYGLIKWVKKARLLSLILDLNEQATSEAARLLLGDRYKPVNFDIPGGEVAMDNLDGLSELAKLGYSKAAELKDVLQGWTTLPMG
jgi:hypothetical protein